MLFASPWLLVAALSWGCACGTACCAHVGASPALEVERIEALRVGTLTDE